MQTPKNCQKTQSVCARVCVLLSIVKALFPRHVVRMQGEISMNMLYFPWTALSTVTAVTLTPQSTNHWPPNIALDHHSFGHDKIFFLRGRRTISAKMKNDRLSKHNAGGRTMGGAYQHWQEHQPSGGTLLLTVRLVTFVIDCLQF